LDLTWKLEKLIKVCAWTKRIKAGGEWLSVEQFMKKYLNKDVTHGISPEAYEKIMDEAHVSESGDQK
jgi:hypothetical protein